MSDLLSIMAEPSGVTYKALLTFAAEHSERFSLVWRQQLDFNKSAELLEGALRPFLVEEAQTNSWPGTMLMGHVALVRTYRTTPEAIAVLATADGLYAWRAPDRPEDLAFYSSGGHRWLGSIAHEADAFVDPRAVSITELRSAVPGLSLE